jgi:magnesium-transporting ATPase (P-type)
MKIHHFTVDEALASVQSRQDGLSTAEAARRLLEFGPNQVAEVRGEPMARRFLKGFTHFFAIILWLAAALALFAEMRAPGQGMAVLGVAIVGVIGINGAFSFWQEYRAEKAFSALQRLLPHQVKARRDGGVAEVSAAALVPGDVVMLLILLIDYTPLGNAVFGTAPIPVAAWLFIVPFALTMVLLEEGRKWLVHSRHARVEKGMAVAIRNPV